MILALYRHNTGMIPENEQITKHTGLYDMIVLKKISDYLTGIGAIQALYRHDIGMIPENEYITKHTGLYDMLYSRMSQVHYILKQRYL